MKSNKNVSGISVIPRRVDGVGVGTAGVEVAGWMGHVQVTDWLPLSLGMFADTLLSP